jgi:hypothetical protein
MYLVMLLGPAFVGVMIYFAEDAEETSVPARSYSEIFPD